MSQRSVELNDYDELKFSREQGFFDKSQAVHAAIGLVFVLVLFFVLHNREVRVDVLELNAKAPKYVVAQVGFDFFDEEATIIEKQEAVRSVGKIYLIDGEEIRKQRIDFENSLTGSNVWKQDIGEHPFGLVMEGVDAVEKVLQQMRMTDVRTLHRVREMGLPSDEYQVYTPVDVSQPETFPDRMWEWVARRAFSDPEYPQDLIKKIITHFQSRSWQLEEDIPTERNLRHSIQSKVPDKYTHVKAGSRIVDQGERVTTRHLAMLQAMKQVMNERRNLWHPLTILGSFILALLLATISWVYFKINHPRVLRSNRKLSLVVTVMILTLLLAKMGEYFILTSQSSLAELVRYPLFVPFAAILLCSLMSPAIATFASGFLTVVLMMSLSFERQGFMITNLAAALMAVLSARTLKRRKEVFIVCLNAWLCCAIVIISMHLYRQTPWSVGLAADLANTGVFMLITAILVVGLLPLLESSFKVMTDVSLMEYMDPNNDLLRRLAIAAPGTYQHSVIVGNLAETAATAIGANGLFCRVAALYHDVGKIATPQYFTENQEPGVNIHQLLTPIESAQVIMAHVSEGVSLARKAGLPEQFIDIIKQHHGTTTVYYFYRKQVEKMGGDESLVDINEFRYSGPKPRTKEAGIIMLADSLEAAHRSLEVKDEASVLALMAKLIRDKEMEGQFSESLLTCEEMTVVKETLAKTLVAFAHSRIAYPKRP